MPDFPFYHFFIDDFLSPEDFAFIKNAVVSANFEARASDLFNFSQTKELKGCTEEVYDLLKSKYFQYDSFIAKLEAVCGEKLEDRFDTSFQKYELNDYLLTHDDLLENRAFAYVLYLVDESWTEEDGGCLALLDCHQSGGVPRNIVTRIVPKRNRVAIFQVSHKSFHYVEEVLTGSKNRYSLTGWFYTEPNCEKQLPKLYGVTVDFEKLLDHLNKSESCWEYIQEAGCAGRFNTTFSANPLPNILNISRDLKLIKRWSVIKFKSTDYLLNTATIKGSLGFMIHTKDESRVEPKNFTNRWLARQDFVIIRPSIEIDSEVYMLALYC